MVSALMMKRFTRRILLYLWLKCHILLIQDMFSMSWLSDLVLQDTHKALRRPQTACDKSSLLTIALSLSPTTSTAF